MAVAVASSGAGIEAEPVDHEVVQRLDLLDGQAGILVEELAQLSFAARLLELAVPVRRVALTQKAARACARRRALAVADSPAAAVLRVVGLRCSCHLFFDRSCRSRASSEIGQADRSGDCGAPRARRGRRDAGLFDRRFGAAGFPSPFAGGRRVAHSIRALRHMTSFPLFGCHASSSPLPIARRSVVSENGTSATAQKEDQPVVAGARLVAFAHLPSPITASSTRGAGRGAGRACPRAPALPAARSSALARSRALRRQKIEVDLEEPHMQLSDQRGPRSHLIHRGMSAAFGPLTSRTRDVIGPDFAPHGYWLARVRRISSRWSASVPPCEPGSRCR